MTKHAVHVGVIVEFQRLRSRCTASELGVRVSPLTHLEGISPRLLFPDARSGAMRPVADACAEMLVVERCFSSGMESPSSGALE